MKKTAVCFVALVLTSVSLLKAAPLTLVENGQPRAAIVVAAGEPKAEQAAAEIQKYVEKMSGAKLPIVKEGEPVNAPVSILVGHTAAAKKLRVEVPAGFNPAVRPEAFEEEGFVIKTKGNNLVIGGNSDGPYQGTIYAGYEFLERLGCRWYFPGEWGEVIPENKTLTFPDTDLRSQPDFALRNVGLGGWFPSTREERQVYRDWNNKIKYTHETFYPLVGDGFLGYLLPPKEFGSDPALYAMNKAGSREQPENFLNGVMLSLYNPKTFELAVKNLQDAFAGTSTSAIKRIISPNGFGISPPDGSAYDYDPEAVKRNQNFDYPTYLSHPMTSEEFFGFAAKLAKEFPDKWVATMAYSGREMPPQGVAVPQNMTVMYAPIATCVLHPFNDPACWRRSETLSIMRQWCQLTPHVYLYDYNPGLLLGSFVPERDVANFAANAKLYKEMKLKGFQAEGRKAFMITWISYYLRGKLMWDVNADVEALKKDFYTTFFGPEAGPLVQQWWDECEKALAATTMHCHEDWLVDHVYTVAFTKKLHQYVAQAAKCAMTPKQKERFAAFALIADHLEACAARTEAEKNLDYAAAIKQAQRMEDDNAKLIAMYSFFIGPKKHPDFNNGWMDRFAEFAQWTNGEKGKLVAPIPLEAKFKRDPYNEGVVAEWYLPEVNDKAWDTKNTFHTWDAQDQPEDAQGHDYDGYGWYRVAVKVPASAVKRPLNLHLGGVINEGWVWVNGEYVGHREWKLWWAGRKELEMDVDVTGKLKAGRNTIAIRVWNSTEPGGLLRRGFVWSPKN
ncbi:DUF4838 domain-containing protein [bacterium]|nr:DUF4838 domain-containing protein [bacterium]